MSVQNPVRPDETDESPDLFAEYLQRNRDVCSNCFRRTHVTMVRTHRYETYDGELVVEKVDGDRYPKPRRAQKDVTERDVRYADTAASDHETNRCPCGMMSNYATLRPIDTDTAIEYAQRIIAELKRQDDVRVVDEDAFYETVREWKSDPDRQFEDDEMFAEATSRAAQLRANIEI